MSWFNVASGVHVPNQWKLAEGFEALPGTDNKVIRANISLERLGSFFQAAVRCLIEPVFLIIEAPYNEVKELELRRGADGPFHSDVYYSELGAPEQILEIFEFPGTPPELKLLVLNNRDPRRIIAAVLE